jgi:hypothetical protein
MRIPFEHLGICQRTSRTRRIQQESRERSISPNSNTVRPSRRLQALAGETDLSQKYSNRRRSRFRQPLVRARRRVLWICPRARTMRDRWSARRSIAKHVRWKAKWSVDQPASNYGMAGGKRRGIDALRTLDCALMTTEGRIAAGGASTPSADRPWTTTDGFNFGRSFVFTFGGCHADRRLQARRGSLCLLGLIARDGGRDCSI